MTILFGGGVPLQTETQTCIEPLKIEPTKIPLEYVFVDYEIGGAFGDFLRGKIVPENLDGSEVDINLLRIIAQLRNQTVECKTSLALTQEGNIQLQQNPSIGTEEGVNNITATPPIGKKVLEIHNHPKLQDPRTGANRTYEWFSAQDLATFALANPPHLAEAVVFSIGTAILVRTPETDTHIAKAEAKARSHPAQRRAQFTKELNEKFEREVPSEADEGRKKFTENFAREYRMKLIFIPADEDTMKILV